ncbi:MAG: hypothetical protein ACRCU2_05715 [Planktothrix sp.]
MNVKEALLFADKVFYRKTGQHLDDMQLGVLEGVLQRKKYGEIATELRCTEGYAKDIGYELWQLFSDFFGEDVDKSNLKSTLLRHSAVDSFNLNVFGNFDKGSVIGSFNLCKPQEESQEFLRGKQQAKIEAITGLREMGLSDEQIAKCLDMTLEAVQNML